MSQNSDLPNLHFKFREPLDHWSQPWNPTRLAEWYHFIRTSNKSNTPPHSPGSRRGGLAPWKKSIWLVSIYSYKIEGPPNTSQNESYMMIVLTLPKPLVTASVWRKEKVDAGWRERVLGCEQQILLPARVVRIRGHPESWVDTKEVAKFEILTLLSKDCMRVDFSHNKGIYNKSAASEYLPSTRSQQRVYIRQSSKKNQETGGLNHPLH